MEKHFKTLEIENDASQEEIQNAYERLSKELDPKNNNDQEFFKEEYQKVQEAYKLLYNSSILSIKKGAKTLNLKEKENNEENTGTPINKKPNSIKILKEITEAILSIVMIKVIFQIYFFRTYNMRFQEIIEIDRDFTYVSQKLNYGQGLVSLFVVSILLYLFLRIVYQIKSDKIITRTFYLFLFSMVLLKMHTLFG